MIIGTRGSDLALWQARHVAQLLLTKAELKVITTRGDVDMRERLVGKLDKGFFTEELEAELRTGAIDLAVHSLKDLPVTPPAGLTLGAVIERADACDLLLCLPEAVDESRALPLKAGTEVGTSSSRRDALLAHFLRDTNGVPLRGNVPTRLAKLRAGAPKAIILAAAGVRRLGLDLNGLRVFELNPRRWLPAPGQGAIAVQCRAGDTRTSAINHAETARATAWERAVLRHVEGGCTTPLGALAVGDTCHIGLVQGGRWCTGTFSIGDAPDSVTISEALSNLQGDTSHDWLYREID